MTFINPNIINTEPMWKMAMYYFCDIKSLAMNKYHRVISWNLFFRYFYLSAAGSNAEIWICYGCKWFNITPSSIIVLLMTPMRLALTPYFMEIETKVVTRVFLCVFFFKSLPLLSPIPIHIGDGPDFCTTPSDIIDVKSGHMQGRMPAKSHEAVRTNMIKTSTLSTNDLNPPYHRHRASV